MQNNPAHKTLAVVFKPCLEATPLRTHRPTTTLAVLESTAQLYQLHPSLPLTRA